MNIELNIMLQNSWRWEHCKKKIAQALGITQ
jgi:hypothetical protein